MRNDQLLMRTALDMVNRREKEIMSPVQYYGTRKQYTEEDLSPKEKVQLKKVLAAAKAKKAASEKYDTVVLAFNEVLKPKGMCFTGISFENKPLISQTDAAREKGYSEMIQKKKQLAEKLQEIRLEICTAIAGKDFEKISEILKRMP